MLELTRSQHKLTITAMLLLTILCIASKSIRGSGMRRNKASIKSAVVWSKRNALWCHGVVSHTVVNLPVSRVLITAAVTNLPTTTITCAPTWQRS
jgi:hypothetical protein